MYNVLQLWFMQIKLRWLLFIDSFSVAWLSKGVASKCPRNIRIQKNLFLFSSIPELWDDADNGNPYSRKTRTNLLYIVKTVALTIWRNKEAGRASATTTLTKFFQEMMTSLKGKDFPRSGPLYGEFTGHRWIPRTKASDAKLWCFLWSAPE